MTTNKIIKSSYIEIDFEEFDYSLNNFIRSSRPCGFKKNLCFNIDDLPIPIKKENNFINFNSVIEKNNSLPFPDEIEKGINKYIKIVDNFKNTKNPHISVEKAINREYKKKNGKSSKCKIIKKKIRVNFK